MGVSLMCLPWVFILRHYKYKAWLSTELNREQENRGFHLCTPTPLPPLPLLAKLWFCWFQSRLLEKILLIAVLSPPPYIFIFNFVHCHHLLRGPGCFASSFCLFCPLLFTWGRMAEGGSNHAHHQQTQGTGRSAQHHTGCLTWIFRGKSQSTTSMVREKQKTMHFFVWVWFSVDSLSVK